MVWGGMRSVGILWDGEEEEIRIGNRSGMQPWGENRDDPKENETGHRKRSVGITRMERMRKFALRTDQKCSPGVKTGIIPKEMRWREHGKRSVGISRTQKTRHKPSEHRLGASPTAPVFPAAPSSFSHYCLLGLGMLSLSRPGRIPGASRSCKLH